MKELNKFVRILNKLPLATAINIFFSYFNTRGMNLFELNEFTINENFREMSPYELYLAFVNSPTWCIKYKNLIPNKSVLICYTDDEMRDLLLGEVNNIYTNTELFIGLYDKLKTLYKDYKEPYNTEIMNEDYLFWHVQNQYLQNGYIDIDD